MKLCFWSCMADHRTLEPADKDFLNGECHAIDAIDPGFYLFAQKRLHEISGVPDNKVLESICMDLSRDVWLEGLWRGAVMKDNRVLTRTLYEDGETVVQVLRAVEKPVKT